MHTHMVEGGHCFQDPINVLETHFHRVASLMEGSAVRLQLMLALGEPVEGLQIARTLESAVAETRALIATKEHPSGRLPTPPNSRNDSLFGF